MRGEGGTREAGGWGTASEQKAATPRLQATGTSVVTGHCPCPDAASTARRRGIAAGGDHRRVAPLAAASRRYLRRGQPLRLRERAAGGGDDRAAAAPQARDAGRDRGTRHPGPGARAPG